jgi:hypothetical protein
MMRHTHLEHRFVEQLPERLEPGVLYICMEYATSAHSCCCGCGEEVVTPFTPTDWKMTFDGETVSLSPSIGNWNFTCRSHYFIRCGQVIEAATWTDKQVEDNRRMDSSVKAQYYGTIDLTETKKPTLDATPQTATSDLVLGLRKWIHHKRNKLTQKLDRWLKRS